MFTFNDPDQIVAGLGIGGFLIAAFWRLIVWVREAPVKPDPWDANVEQQLQEAPETCPHCSTPQQPNAWFCPHCGRSVGPYNNLMPYVQVFSEGEVLRNSGQRHFRNRPLILIGYGLIGLTFFPFFLKPIDQGIIMFALLALYLNSLFRKWKQQNDTQKSTKD